MAVGESFAQRQARLDRAAQAFPELSGTDTQTVMQIDALRRSEGRQPTSFGLAVERAYAMPPDPGPQDFTPDSGLGYDEAGNPIRPSVYDPTSIGGGGRSLQPQGGGLLGGIGDVLGRVGETIGNFGDRAFDVLGNPSSPFLNVGADRTRGPGLAGQRLLDFTEPVAGPVAQRLEDFANKPEVQIASVLAGMGGKKPVGKALTDVPDDITAIYAKMQAGQSLTDDEVRRAEAFIGAATSGGPGALASSLDDTGAVLTAASQADDRVLQMIRDTNKIRIEGGRAPLDDIPAAWLKGREPSPEELAAIQQGKQDAMARFAQVFAPDTPSWEQPPPPVRPGSEGERIGNAIVERAQRAPAVAPEVPVDVTPEMKPRRVRTPRAVTPETAPPPVQEPTAVESPPITPAEPPSSAVGSPPPPRPPLPPDTGAIQPSFGGMEPPKPKMSLGDTLADIAQAPLTWKSTYDLSAPGRQLAPMLYAHPTEIPRVIRAQWRALRDPAKFEASQQAIAKADDFVLMKASGLDLGELTAGREEQIGSRLATKVLPGSGRFNNAYTGAINEGRTWLWRAMVKDVDPAMLTEAGLKQGGLAELQRISRLVNASTGRGNFGQYLNGKVSGQPILWAPRLLAGRLQLPASAIFTSSGTVRKEAIRQVVAFFGVNSALLGMIKASGVADVELDPRSSDFGQIRIGTRRIDPWAGYRPIANLIARMSYTAADLVSKDEIPNFKGVASLTGEGKLSTRAGTEIIGNFLRSKLAPVPGEVMNQWTGKDVIGNKLPEDAIGRAWHGFLGLAAPLFLENLAEEVWNTAQTAAGKGENVPAAVAGTVAGNIPSFVGMGGGNYQPNPSDRAAVGEYAQLKPDEQLEGIRNEGWRLLKQDPGAPPALRQYASYSAWADAERKRLLPLAQAEAAKMPAGRRPTPGEIDVAVQKRIDASPVSKAFARARTKVKNDWVVANPQLALDNYDRNQKLPYREQNPDWSLTEAQREAAHKALAARPRLQDGGAVLTDTAWRTVRKTVQRVVRDPETGKMVTVRKRDQEPDVVRRSVNDVRRGKDGRIHTVITLHQEAPVGA